MPEATSAFQKNGVYGARWMECWGPPLLGAGWDILIASCAARGRRNGGEGEGGRAHLLLRLQLLLCQPRRRPAHRCTRLLLLLPPSEALGRRAGPSRGPRPFGFRGRLGTAPLLQQLRAAQGARTLLLAALVLLLAAVGEGRGRTARRLRVLALLLAPGLGIIGTVSASRRVHPATTGAARYRAGSAEEDARVPGPQGGVWLRPTPPPPPCGPGSVRF